MGGGGVCQEEKVEVEVVGPDRGGQNPTTLADAVAVAAPEQVGKDMMVKVVEMMKNLRTVDLSLHGDLGPGWAAHV